MTPEQETTIIEGLALGQSMRQVAAACDPPVSHTSVSRLLDRDVDVRRRVAAARRNRERQEKRASQRAVRDARRASGDPAANAQARPELAGPVPPPTDHVARIAHESTAPGIASGPGASRPRRRPSDAAGRPGRILLIGGSHLGSSHEARCEWLTQHDARREDPPVELRLRDPLGIERDYRVVPASEAPALQAAGWERLP